MRYDYKCLQEDVVFEVEQKLDEAPLERCPVCSGKLQKLPSFINFELKGKGWFKTGGY